MQCYNEFEFARRRELRIYRLHDVVAFFDF